MKLHRRVRRSMLLTAAVIGWSSLFLSAPPQAHAGYFSDMYNGIRELSELPDEVRELKVNYQMTQDKLEEANTALENYRLQNEALLEQNRELTETVSALTQAQQAREAQARKLRTVIFTGVLLIAGYFILLRIVRMLLRR